MRKLKMMPPMSAEATVTRTYLDTILSLPWVKRTSLPVSAKDARKVLDSDHYGLDKIKERILEHLAVQKRVPNGKAPILCFVGPPGVGKTSLGRGIAAATGRVFGAHFAGRRARRSRNSRASPHLYRFNARKKSSTR